MFFVLLHLHQIISKKERKGSMHFEGTLKECLERFGQAARFVRGQRATYVRCNSISRLFGINERTGHAWFLTYDQLPLGEKAMKLIYFLKLAGFKVTGEPETTDKVLKRVADQVALGVTDCEEIAIRLHTTAKVVLSNIHRGAGVSQTRLEEYRTLAHENQKKAEKVLTEWKEVISELGITEPEEVSNDVPTAMPAVSPQPEPEPKAFLPETKEALIGTLAALIMAGLPLAERILSDEFTPADREELRRRTATARSNGVFDLSNRLDRLCGETARQKIGKA